MFCVIALLYCFRAISATNDLLTPAVAATSACGLYLRRREHDQPPLRIALPPPLAPVPGAVEIKIDHRGGVERQDLADDQPAEDGDAQGLAEFAAFSEPDHQRHRAEQGRHGGH